LNVADLFKKRLFPDFTLVGGNLGLGREISAVTVMDSPDIDQWLRGGEFVIGNGFMFKNTPEQFAPLVKRIAERGAAAIGMKFGRFHSTFPFSALTAAERLSLPIIDIPIIYRWTDVIEIIYSVLLLENNKNKRSSFWDFYWTIEKSFSQLAQTLDRDLLLVCPQLDLNVVLFLATGEVKEGYSLYRTLPGFCPVELPSPKDIFLSCRLLKANDDSSRVIACYSELLHNAPSEVYLILKKGEQQPSLRQERSIKLALLMLRAEYLERNITLQRPQKDRQKFFLEHLCKGIFYGDEEIMRSNALEYGVDIKFPCQIVLIQGLLSHTPTTVPGVVLSYENKDICVGLLDVKSSKENLRQHAVDTRSHIVIGTVAHTFMGIAVSYKNASDTLALIKELHLPPDLYAHDRFAFFDMLSKMGTSPSTQEIWHTYWHPLIHYASKGCIALEKFASVFVSSGYNLKQTSDELHVHYNTARKYVHRLEKLLNIDFDRKTCRFLLDIAYHTHLATYDRSKLLREVQNE
jgi:purine catabolism regulator